MANRIHGARWNKEKLLCLTALIALLLTAHHYWRTKPDELAPGSALIARNPPADPVSFRTHSHRAFEEGSLTKFEDSPFDPFREEGDMHGQSENRGVQPPIEPDQNQLTNSTGTSIRAKDGEPALRFMGVVMVGGESRGLLASKDGSVRFRVRPGQRIDRLEKTTLRIEKQSVHLMSEDHTPCVLKNTRFGHCDRARISRSSRGRPSAH